MGTIDASLSFLPLPVIQHDYPLAMMWIGMSKYFRKWPVECGSFPSLSLSGNGLFQRKLVWTRTVIKMIMESKIQFGAVDSMGDDWLLLSTEDYMELRSLIHIAEHAKRKESFGTLQAILIFVHSLAVMNLNISLIWTGILHTIRTCQTYQVFFMKTFCSSHFPTSPSKVSSHFLTMPKCPVHCSLKTNQILLESLPENSYSEKTCWTFSKVKVSVHLLELFNYLKRKEMLL